MLSKIRILQIHDRIIGTDFNVREEGWMSDFWPVLLTQMPRLLSLSIKSLGNVELYELLRLFTAAQAQFMGARPKISMQVDARTRWTDYSLCLEHRRETMFKLAPRFNCAAFADDLFGG